ncbi:2319_t:CDS:2 [Cetraspora pellucida]|uniref:2319_t:CDS:1 n=1 Tax=Cetraspora pellucida TaxID=1433469 RepID=A0A9N8WL99_9GLOM|nr:2319_t:CDS:2 [Cetraspora pellucida]
MNVQLREITVTARDVARAQARGGRGRGFRGGPRGRSVVRSKEVNEIKDVIDSVNNGRYDQCMIEDEKYEHRSSKPIDLKNYFPERMMPIVKPLVTVFGSRLNMRLEHFWVL